MSNIEKRLDHINKDLSIEVARKIKEPDHRGICLSCGEIKNTIKMRRKNTQYVDKDSNYIESCIECFNDEQEYWAEMWREYYSDKL